MNTLRCITLMVAVLLVSCAQPGESIRPAADLQGKKWVLLYISDYLSSIVPGESFIDGSKHLALSFQNEQFGGYDGCNAFGGRYAATATTLRFLEVSGTTRGCDAEILSQAEAYLGALEQVATYRTEDDRLYLQNDKGREILEFSEANAAYSNDHNY